MGLQQKLYLGNLDTKIDFGYAREYMDIAWKVMQQDTSDDYIICTEEVHSVREFLEEAFKHVGLNADDYVEFDPRFARPSKTSTLLGDNSKLRQKVGVVPEIKFSQLIKLMIEHDLRDAKIEKEAKESQSSQVQSDQVQ